MDGLELLRLGRSEMAARGQAIGTRMDRGGSVCALGALDVVVGAWSNYAQYEWHNYFGHESLPAYQEAVMALAESVGHDPDNPNPDYAVAAYSNGHTLDEVLAWFDNAILHKELEHPAAPTPSLPEPAVLSSVEPATRAALPVG